MTRSAWSDERPEEDATGCVPIATEDVPELHWTHYLTVVFPPSLVTDQLGAVSPEEPRGVLHLPGVNSITCVAAALTASFEKG